MLTRRILGLTTGLLFVALAGCETDDYETTRTTEEVITEPTMETVEVPVMTEDTLMVERQADIEVQVDTVRMD